MAKHTPGAWKAMQVDLHGDEEDGDPSRWSVVVDGERNYFIATIENGAPGDSLDTEAANARLIAAAPELLAACKAALADDSNPTLEPGLRLATSEQIRAAIAKAEPPAESDDEPPDADPTDLYVDKGGES